MSEYYKWKFSIVKGIDIALQLAVKKLNKKLQIVKFSKL